MKINRDYNDAALNLPLLDIRVYYTADKKYKVIDSLMPGGFRFISVGRSDGKLPKDATCQEILKALGIKNACPVAIGDAASRKDVRKYMYMEEENDVML